MIEVMLKKLFSDRYYKDIHKLYEYNECLIVKMRDFINQSGISDEHIFNRLSKIKSNLLKLERRIDFNYEIFIEIYNIYLIMRLDERIYNNSYILKNVANNYKENQDINIDKQLFINLFEVCENEKLVKYTGWREKIMFGDELIYGRSCIFPKYRYFSFEVANEIYTIPKEICDDYFFSLNN